MSQAEHILERLRLAGFSRNDISVLLTKGGARAGVESVERELEWLGIAASVQAESIVMGGPTLVGSFNKGRNAFKSLGEALSNFGIQPAEVERYEQSIHAGGIWFSVVVSNQDGVDRARWIFEDAGAEQISTTRESRILEPRKLDLPAADPASKRVRRKRFGRPFFS